MVWIPHFDQNKFSKTLKGGYSSKQTYQDQLDKVNKKGWVKGFRQFVVYDDFNRKDGITLCYIMDKVKYQNKEDQLNKTIEFPMQQAMRANKWIRPKSVRESLRRLDRMGFIEVHKRPNLPFEILLIKEAFRIPTGNRDLYPLASYYAAMPNKKKPKDEPEVVPFEDLTYSQMCHFITGGFLPLHQVIIEAAHHTAADAICFGAIVSACSSAAENDQLSYRKSDNSYGWFRLSTQMLCNALRIQPRRLRDYLADMQDKDFIEIEVNGNNRYCRLKMDGFHLLHLIPKPKIKTNDEELLKPHKKSKIKLPPITTITKRRKTSTSGFGFGHDTADKYYKAADRFKAHALPRRLTKCQWTPANQASHFRKLSKEVGWTRFADVLRWYMKQGKTRDDYKQHKLPNCTSPAQFRNNWRYIVHRYDRRPREDSAISIEAQVIADQLINYGWPKGSGNQLPRVIQDSLEFCKEFKAALWEMLEDAAAKHTRMNRRKNPIRDKSDKRYWYFVKKQQDARLDMLLLEQVNVYAIPDVFNWYSNYYDQIRSWKEWSGVIPTLSYQDGRFRKHLTEIIQSYNGAYGDDLSNQVDQLLWKVQKYANDQKKRQG